MRTETSTLVVKKIITRILLIFSLFGLTGVSFMNFSYAAPESTSDGITVIVTEEIPGARCLPNSYNQVEGAQPSGGGPGAPVNGTKVLTYKCTVEKGFKSIVKMMGAIIKYFTFIAGLGGVLYLVINGIMYSMGGMDEALKSKSKELITKTLVGLIVLFLSGVILNIIAPWIYK